MLQANSIDRYMQIIDEYSVSSEQYFRGQLEKYTHMSPSIARDPGYLENESKIYHEAVELGRTALDELHTPLERLSKLQHYGIPTRLVDVTIDPLIALYFAVEDVDDPSHGNIYLYQTEGYSPDSLEVQVLSLLPTIANLSAATVSDAYKKEFGHTIANDEVLRIVNFPIIMKYSNFLQKSNPRLHKQKGTFLICGNNVDGNEIKSSIRSLDIYEPTIIIRIPYEYKHAIKEELDAKYAINITSIYPELPSVSEYIKSKYRKVNMSLNGTYSVVKKEDISFSVVKRISITIVLNQQLSIEQVKSIAIDIMRQHQESQHVVWLYIARTGDDYITSNWLLRAQWIDPKLKPGLRPLTLKIEESGYYWDYNESYSTIADINSTMVFSSDYELCSKHKALWERFVQIHKRLSDASKSSWIAFTLEVRKSASAISRLFIELQDLGHSHDKEFDDFLGMVSVAVGTVDDLHLILKEDSATDKGIQYLVNKKLDEASNYIEQINRGFSKWCSKAR